MLDIETGKKAPFLKPMDGEAFAGIRAELAMSQRSLAGHLGLSLKAVESYEQGWRPVPPNVERLLYFLYFKLRSGALKGVEACWKSRACPRETRDSCVAYLSKEGQHCWFLTGKVCAQEWEAGDSETACRSCSHFLDLLARAQGPRAR